MAKDENICSSCGQRILFPQWVFTHKTIFTQSKDDRRNSTPNQIYATERTLVPDEAIPICPACKTPIYQSSVTRTNEK